MKLAFCALAILLAAPELAAQGKTAQVSALEGRAQKSRAGGAPVQLRLGAAVLEGDAIETADTARLEIRFSDNSVLRLGPKARLLLAEAHFAAGPAKRRMTAKLFFGNLWANVTRAIQGDQRFQIETENAVAGVRGTEFRVDAREDKSVRVRVYDGAVAVAKNAPAYAKPAEERHEVEGPQEVSREQWEKIVGRQMEIEIAPDGTPGDPAPFAPETDKGDPFAQWNQQRDAAKK